MLPRNSNSTATGNENPVRVEDQSLSSDRPDVVQQESTNSATTTDLHYSLWRGFTILNGGVGHGYDRVFADCLDEKLTSVRVEDPYIRSDFQIQNFFRFCKLLDQKCKNLERITLITKNQGQKYEKKVRQKVERTLGDRLHFEYKDFHDRKIDFDNGWRVMLGRGLDYFNKLANPSSGDTDDMNRRTCKDTTITILRDGMNVNADREFREMERVWAREGRLLGEYTERAVIGRGGFGVVFKARHKIDKGWYTIKQVDPVNPVDTIDVADTEQSSNKVLREVHILAKLDHPHIVRYYDAWLEIPPPGEELPRMDSNQPCLYIRMEWCSGSTLHEWLGKNKLPAQRPISQILNWFSQLTSAVKHIHDKKLIHRDIKPENIFFGSSRNGATSVLKIGDFELATYAASPPSGVSGDVSRSLSVVGTPSYMSPEQPSGHYKNSTDVFSLGLVFLEMVYPFNTDRERRSVFGALRAKQRPPVMNKLDKEMSAIIRRMTAFEPKKRPTASELDNELKKTEHPDTGGLSVDDGILKKVSFTELLPLKPMLKIFGYLYEGDLAQCALVSREFRAIANHRALWKSLYQEVFEYSLPLLHVGHAQFEFREPRDWPQPQSDEFIIVNPWKESFKQLKDGIHVRPGYASLYSGFGAGGRRLTQCDRLDQALWLVKARGKNAEKLIFLHTGLYVLETTVTINSDVQIIGASAGPDIASQVIIERRRTTTVILREGSQGAYLGWMTVRCASDSGAMAAAIAARNPRVPIHYALQIHGDSTALVEHCIIHSSPISRAAVYVEGSAANPKMRHCVVCDCESAGIYVTNAAQGQFEDCEITRNNGPGVCVDGRANPFFRRCHIHDGRSYGIFTSKYSMGYFESCNIHNNRFSGIEVKSAANPTVTRCEVHHGQQSGVYVHSEGRGRFIENRIHSNVSTGIWIESHSDPRITRNKIWGNQEFGVIVNNNGEGMLEDNEIFDNAMAGVGIGTDGNPILTYNKIYDGRGEGVRISDKGRGTLKDNDIYCNALAGMIIESESNPKITYNKIWNNQKGGVLIHDNGQGVLEENDIFDHLHSGVEIKTGSNPKITRNKIRSNQKGGVLIYDYGQGVLEDNEIFDNAMAGVWIYTDGNPMLRRNTIYNGRSKGVRISNKGRGVLEDNDIHRNARVGVLISSKSNSTLRRNRVYEGRTAGIEIRRGAMPTLESNAIFHNRFGGLFLATGVRPTLRDNRIYDNDDLVEKTVAKGGCLFEIAPRTSPAMHDFYRCDTCNTTEEDAICLNCIRTCHAGHDVRLVCCDRFFCRCGAGRLKHQCKLLSEARDNDSALSLRELRTAVDATRKLTVSRRSVSL